MPLLGFPLGTRGQEKVPGTGTTEEEPEADPEAEVKSDREEPMQVYEVLYCGFI